MNSNHNTTREDEIKKVWKKYYHKITANFQSSEIISTNLAIETVSFMFVLSDVAATIAGSNRKHIAKLFSEWQDNLLKFKYLTTNTGEIIDQRADLYGEFVRGKMPRCDWSLIDMDFHEEDSVGRCCAAFGDILINPDCAEDYDEAPLHIHGIDLIMDFIPRMKSLREEATNYIKELFEKYSELNDTTTNNEMPSPITDDEKNKVDSANFLKKDTGIKEVMPNETTATNHAKKPRSITVKENNKESAFKNSSKNIPNNTLKKIVLSIGISTLGVTAFLLSYIISFLLIGFLVILLSNIPVISTLFEYLLSVRKESVDISAMFISSGISFALTKWILGRLSKNKNTLFLSCILTGSGVSLFGLVFLIINLSLGNSIIANIFFTVTGAILAFSGTPSEE